MRKCIVLRVLLDALTGALREAQSKALRLITEEKPKTPAIPQIQVAPAPPLPPPKPGRKLIDQGREEFQRVADAREKLDQLGKLAAGGRHIKVTLTWQVEEDTASS